MEEIEAEIAKPSADVEKLRHLLREHGVPSQHRGVIWQQLLGVYKKSANLELWDNQLNLQDQQVIRADVLRTRRNDPVFQSESTLADLELLLTLYCKRRSVAYTQGLNELIAVFFLLPDFDNSAIFNCFYSLVAKFLPNTFRGDDFTVLTRSFSFVRFLVQYHDPTLSFFLDQSEIRPDTYSTSWFLTLFARGCDKKVVFDLWDYLLIESDPFLIYFLAAALLISKRDVLLAADRAEAPAVVCSLTFRSEDEVASAIVTAKELDARTPRNFRRKLFTATLQNDASPDIDSQIENSMCLTVTPTEIVRKDALDLKFFVVDCRPQSAFNCGHLPTGVCVDPSLIHSEPEQFSELLSTFDGLKGSVHFCLMGAGQAREAALYTVLGQFLAKGLPFVSTLEGGYAAVHALFEKNEVDLSDHTAKGCAACSSKTGSKPSSASSTTASLSSSQQQHQSTSGQKQTAAPPPKTETKKGFGGFGGFASGLMGGKTLGDLAAQAKAKSQVGLSMLQQSDAVQAATAVAKSKAKETGSMIGAFLAPRHEEVKDAPPPDIKNEYPAALVSKRKGKKEFSIDDEDDEGDDGFGPSESGAAADGATGNFAMDSLINVTHWMSKPFTSFFPCQKLGQNGELLQRYLVVSDAVVMNLEAHRTKLNVAKLKSYNKLIDLERITFNKNDKSLVTFVFQTKGSKKPVGHVYVLAVPQLRACVKLIQDNLQRLKSTGSGEADVSQEEVRTATATAATSATTTNVKDTSHPSSPLPSTIASQPPAAAKSVVQQPTSSTTPTNKKNNLVDDDDETPDFLRSPAPAPPPQTTAAPPAAAPAAAATAKPASSLLSSGKDEDELLDWLNDDTPVAAASAAAGAAGGAGNSDASGKTTTAETKALLDDDDIPDWLAD